VSLAVPPPGVSRMTMVHPKREVLGVGITACSLPEAVDAIELWIKRRERGVVCFANVHVVETASRDRELAEALAEAELVLPDGAPVAWALRWLYGERAIRVPGADVFAELGRRSAFAGYRVFLLGSTVDTLGRLSRAMAETYPGIDVCGVLSPPFAELGQVDLRALASRVNEARPDIVWVGVGAPKQEKWMRALRPQLEAPAIAGVGAVFDFASGGKPRAPIVLQRAGLEWAHRLAQEPRRLWRRYLITNATFVARLTVARASRGSRDR